MPEDNPLAAPQGAKSKKNKNKKNKGKKNDEQNPESQGPSSVQEIQPHENLGTSSSNDDNKPDSSSGKTMNQAAVVNDSNHDADGNPSEGSVVDWDIEPEHTSNLDSPNSDAFQSKDRFDALVRDRDSLRTEVADIRRSLEDIQSKHRLDMELLQGKLDDAENKKEHAELQFQKLLERVNKIKSQLGERLKEDAEELAQARTRIEELEDENTHMKEQLDSKDSELADVSDDAKQKVRELSALRERTNLSQQNWLKEKEELMEQESYLQSEFEQAKDAMHNWEILAMEERSIRENLGEKVVDLEEQLAGLKDAYENAAAERDSQLAAVEGLQRALQEIQTARRQELRELVESSDAQLEELKQALRDADKKAFDADSVLQAAQNELERVRPFEKEVKEKNLLIGKLRHEAVTLNDHLTKALRFLKKGKPEDNVDRSDPKKFQILQLIAALLGWSDEQREQAGLARPGTSNTTGAKLKVPGTPVNRTPSTPTLATEFLDNGTASNGKESLAELWSNFLEQEAQAGSQNTLRRGSQARPQKP